jgi:hypothetical protein
VCVYVGVYLWVGTCMLVIICPPSIRHEHVVYVCVWVSPLYSPSQVMPTRNSVFILRLALSGCVPVCVCVCELGKKTRLLEKMHPEAEAGVGQRSNASNHNRHNTTRQNNSAREGLGRRRGRGLRRRAMTPSNMIACHVISFIPHRHTTNPTHTYTQR